MLAGDEPAFTVARVPVGIVRWRTIDADMTVVLRPAHDAIVRDVAPQKIAPIAEVNRAFRPAETCGDALDIGIPDLVLESRVERFDTRVGITRAGKGTQRQGVSERCFGRNGRNHGRTRSTGQKCPSLHSCLPGIVARTILSQSDALRFPITDVQSAYGQIVDDALSEAQFPGRHAS